MQSGASYRSLPLSHPVQLSLNAVVQDLGSQLGLSQLRAEERWLHSHTLETLPPPQVPGDGRHQNQRGSGPSLPVLKRCNIIKLCICLL